MLFDSPFSSNVGFCVLDSRTAANVNLLPEERSLIPSGGSSPDFLGALVLGRAAAHQALAQIGIPAETPLLRSPQHTPAWPQGIEGSISHCAKGGFTTAGAATCRLDQFAGIGIDIENTSRKISDAVINAVCTPAEREWCHQAGSSESPRRAIQIFSAKEAMFKAFRLIFPVGRVFQAAELRFDAASGCFEATISPAIPGYFTSHSEHWISLQENDSTILTALAVLPEGNRWEPEP